MQDIRRLSGVQLRLPDDMSLADGHREAEGSRGFDFSKPIPLDVPPDPMWGELRNALGGARFDLVDTLDIVPGSPPGTVRSAAPSVTFDVPIDDDEDAVVLLEEDGVLTWMLPAAEVTGVTDDPIRGGGTGRARRFSLQLDGERDVGGKRVLDWVTGWVGKRVKAMVLRFAAKLVAGLAAKAVVSTLEAELRVGPVHVRSRDPLRWRAIDDLSGVRTPEAPRVLLLVHGTFSSTLGSFGHLATGPGRHVLTNWLDDYDLIVGFDHATLSASPEENAEQILEGLGSHEWTGRAEVDVVCYSRGGMVARWLIEQLLPDSGLPLDVRHVVCVAATNSGTLLARPENWKTFLDMTTNLASAACRVSTLLAPQTAIASAILGQVVNGVAVLVKALTSAALEDGHVPGLQAMNPDGDFAGRLNGGDPPRIGDKTLYFAVVSNFEPKLFKAPDREKTGLPPRLAQWAADLFVDSLFDRAPNDLVVHNESTTTIHPALQHRMASGQVLALADSREVYHLNFFLSEHTAPRIGEFTAEAAGDMPRDFAAGPDDEALGGGSEDLVDLFAEANAPLAARVGQTIPLEVNLQREPFATQLRPGSDRAEAKAKPDQDLTIVVLPRRGLVVTNDMVKIVAVPEPGDPQSVLFMLTGVEALDVPAEVSVNVRQGNDKLMQLELAIEVVAADEVPQPGQGSAVATVPVDRGTPAAVQLRVQRFQAVGGPTLAFSLEAPGLHLNTAYAHVTLPADYREQIERTYKRIEADWSADKGRPDSFEAKLRGRGKELGARLLPEALRRDLWTHRDALEGFALVSDEPFVPWELVYVQNPDDAGEGHFLAELGFTRSMFGAFCPDVIRVRRGGRHTVVPRYPAQLHLDFALEEEVWLHEKLGSQAVTIRPPDRARGLRNLVADGGPVDLLHFAGHGDADEDDVYLVMGGDNEADLFRSQRLGTIEVDVIRLLADDGGRALVFVNACKTGMRVSAMGGERSWAQKFLRDGQAGAFVAPLWSVGDQRASEFSKAFYTALLAGKTFGTASRIARDEARAAGDPSWVSYTVFASPHATVEFQ